MSHLPTEIGLVSVRPPLANASIAAAFLAGVGFVETVHEGGFWQLDALVVTIISLVVLILQLVIAPPDARGWAVLGAVVLTSTWWFVRAITVGPIASFLPLGASMLAFAAAFAAVRALGPRARSDAAFAVGLLGAFIALAGFVGLIWRWYPLSLMSQHTWRLASTITYSDAAGLLIAVCLLVGLGLDTRPRLSRAIVCLCTGGLAATQSRGALVAFACGCAFVPVERYWKSVVPLIAGFVIGVVAVATSPQMQRLPWLAITLVLAMGLSMSGASRWVIPRTGWQKIALVGAVAVIAIVGAAIVRNEIGLRALAPSDQDRAVEWSAALHQFESSPLLGVGPDRLLTFHAPDGTYAHFAHNEYLQVLADGGAVGFALVLVAAGALARSVRRFDLISSCAVGGLMGWVVAPIFDFDWHLPIVGLLGGWIAGLAAAGRHETT